MKQTPNYREDVITLPNMLVYRTGNESTLAYLQSSHLFGGIGCVDHEPQTFRFGGRRPAYGQSLTLRRLCRFIQFSTARLAAALGWLDIHQLCYTRDRDRDRPTYYGSGAKRVYRRYRRQSDRRGCSSDFLSSVLDTTPQLIRRFPCAV